MGHRLPDPLYFSLLDALTNIVERIDMPTNKLTKVQEQQTLWSLFLGVTVWFLHQNILNALISVSCKWGWLTFPVGGLSGLQFAEAAISLVALIAMLIMIYLPWRNWRNFQERKPTDNPNLLQDTEEDRRPLLAFVAMTLNGFFLLFVIATFVPMFALKTCGQV